MAAACAIMSRDGNGRGRSSMPPERGDLDRDCRARAARVLLRMAILPRTARGNRPPQRGSAAPRRIRAEHPSAHGHEARLLRGEDIAGRLPVRAETPAEAPYRDALLQ